MTIQKYILRVVRYIFRLVLLLGLIFVLMVITKTSQASGAELLEQMFGTQKGIIMLVVLLGISLFSPKFNYAERTVMLDMKEDRNQILEVMSKMGFRLSSEQPEQMIFASEGLVRKIMTLGDDKIVVSGGINGAIILEGQRKYVVVAEFRLNSIVESKKA